MLCGKALFKPAKIANPIKSIKSSESVKKAVSRLPVQ